MALTDQAYTVRLPLPDLIVRGVDHVLYAPVYLDGNLIEPASPTITIYNAANTAVVSAAAATVTAEVTQYTVPAATTAELQLEEGWRVEWSLPITNGPTLTPRNRASLVRNGLWPVIGSVDINRRVPALDPANPACITTQTDHQWALDEAWTEIQLMIFERGNRPNLILEPSALRRPHLLLALHYRFADLAHRLDLAHQEAAAGYRRDFDQAMAQVSFEYDVGDDGQRDSRRRSGSPTISLMGDRSSTWRYRWGL